MELFAGSVDDSSRSRIQVREGRALRKEHPLGGTFGPSLDGPSRRTGRPADPCDNPGDGSPSRSAAGGRSSSLAVRAPGGRLRHLEHDRRPASRQPGELAAIPVAPTTGARSGHASTPRSSARSRQLRELKAKTPVEPTLLDEATLKKNMSASFAKDNPPELVAANQRLFELMGLVPAGSSLADLYVEAARAARSPATTTRTRSSSSSCRSPAASGPSRSSSSPTSSTTRSRTRTSA